MGNSRTFQIATAGVLVLNLLAVSALGADAAKPSGSSGSSGNASCVAVSGGTSINTTTLDVVADGGTAITDSSGGSGNLASGGGDGNGGRNNNNHHNNNNNNNHKNNNKNNFSSMSVQDFENRLLQTDTASSGNGGVSTSSANGGAIQIGDVNSGGNAGNAIEVGDTHCAAAPYNAPAGNPGGGGKAGGGGTIRALPSTGAGVNASDMSSSLFFALGSLSLAGLAAGFGLNRRGFRLGSR